MRKHNDFYLRVFTFWFDRERIIPGNFGFAISVSRFVFHDLDLYVFRCAIGRQL